MERDQWTYAPGAVATVLIIGLETSSNYYHNALPIVKDGTVNAHSTAGMFERDSAFLPK